MMTDALQISFAAVMIGGAASVALLGGSLAIFGLLVTASNLRGR